MEMSDVRRFKKWKYMNMNMKRGEEGVWDGTQGTTTTITTTTTTGTRTTGHATESTARTEEDDFEEQEVEGRKRNADPEQQV